MNDASIGPGWAVVLAVALGTASSGCVSRSAAAARQPRGPVLSVVISPAERWYGWPHQAPLRIEAVYEGAPVEDARVFARPLDPAGTLRADFDVRDGAFYVEPGTRLALGAFHPDHGYAECEIVMPTGNGQPLAATAEVTLPAPRESALIRATVSVPRDEDDSSLAGFFIHPYMPYPVEVLTPGFGFPVARGAVTSGATELGLEVPVGTYDVTAWAVSLRSCGVDPILPDPVPLVIERVDLRSGSPRDVPLRFERGAVLDLLVQLQEGLTDQHVEDPRVRLVVRRLGEEERRHRPVPLIAPLGGYEVLDFTMVGEWRMTLERFAPGSYEFILGGPGVERSVHRVEITEPRDDLFGSHEVTLVVTPRH